MSGEESGEEWLPLREGGVVRLLVGGVIVGPDSFKSISIECFLESLSLRCFLSDFA